MPFGIVAFINASINASWSLGASLGSCHLTQSLDPDFNRGSLKRLTSTGGGIREAIKKQSKQKLSNLRRIIGLIPDILTRLGMTFESL